ncbi:MAG: hypothetical protein JNJ73_00135 [Hyphomonadaceae bacterium]|nr:hypothetical protein [Hyphomonadaceae bacterium]
MDLNRFSAIVEAYGADPQRWPEAERAQAQAFAAGNAAAVSGLLAEEGALDLAIAASERDVADPSELLAARILKHAPKGEARVFAPGDRRSVYALAACAVFGLVVGFAGSRAFPTSGADEASDTIIAATFQSETPDELAWLGEEG